METIGKRIKRLRQLRGFKRQDDLGQLVGISQASMSSIESKDLEFSAQNLYDLARVLVVTPEYIMYGIGEDEDMGSLELAQIYKSLTPEGRATLLKMARVLMPDQANEMAA